MRVAFKRREILLGGFAVAGLLALAGAARAQDATEWKAVEDKARAQGRVNFYSVATPEQGERLAAAFNSKYPEIKVFITRGASELSPRLDAERQTGTDGGDVYLHSDIPFFIRNAENLIDAGSPSVARWPDTAWTVKGKAPTASFPPFGMLVWNTEYVKDGLAGWQDVLKPEYAGHIGTREDMTPAFVGYLDFLERELGPDYIAALGKQKPKFYASVVPLVQAVAAGEVWIANIAVPSTVLDLAAQGAPIKAAYPNPGFAIPWGAAALKNSKRPEAARVFLDFIMSPEGQKALNGNGNAASALSGIEGAFDISGFRVMEPEKITQEVRDQWKAKFDRNFR